MTIAIDFDDTFTADPVLWSAFIKSAKARGHKPMCVTGRRNSEENIDLINAEFDRWDCQMPVFFCNLSSKVDTMERHGVKIDVWIDDAPLTLVHGH